MLKKRRNVRGIDYKGNLKGGFYDWKYWRMKSEEIYCWIADMVTELEGGEKDEIGVRSGGKRKKKGRKLERRGLFSFYC